MAGFRKSKDMVDGKRYHCTQIGRFQKAAECIYEAHPETKDDLMEMIKVYGALHDGVCREHYPQESDSWIPINEVIAKRIFGEE